MIQTIPLMTRETIQISLYKILPSSEQKLKKDLRAGEGEEEGEVAEEVLVPLKKEMLQVKVEFDSNLIEV